MSHDVFISYSAKDKPSADAVCAFLEARKIRCWIAPRDLPAGTHWPGGLLSAIDKSRVLVLVFSNGANDSRQVLNEVAAAVKRAIPIIPLRIEAVEPSQDMEYYMETIHWLDAMTPPLEQHLGKLADQVQALLATQAGGLTVTPETQAVETPITPHVQGGRRRPPWTWAAAALGMVLLLAAAGAGLRSLTTHRQNGTTATPPPTGAVQVATVTATLPRSAATAALTAAPDPTTIPAQAAVPPTKASVAVPQTEGPPGPAPTVPSGAAIRAVAATAPAVEGSSVLWSPDGTGLVVGGSEVYFLDAATLKPVRSIKSYSGDNGLAISPDGKTLAIFRTGVRLYDTTSGGELRTLFEQSSVSSATCGAPLAFSPDSATLAVQVGDTVKLYDVASGQELDTIVAKGASSVAFAADGKSLYVGTWQGGIRLDVSTGQPLFSFGGPLGDGSCLALSADGTLLATAGFSGNVVSLRDAATGRQLRTFNGHTAGVTRLAFSPDGRMLASAGDDITIRLWDVATGNELQTLVGHTQTPLSLSFSPDGATLASADRGRGVHLWGIKP